MCSAATSSSSANGLEKHFQEGSAEPQIPYSGSRSRHRPAYACGASCPWLSSAGGRRRRLRDRDQEASGPQPLPTRRRLRLIAHTSLNLCPRSLFPAALGTRPTPGPVAGLPCGFDLSLSPRLMASSEPNILHSPGLLGG